MDFLYRLGGVTRVEQQLSVRFHNEKGDIEFHARRPAGHGQDLVAGVHFGADFASSNRSQGTPS